MKEPVPDTTAAGDEMESPIEEVRLTVPNTDDPSLPVWTFRMWFIGLVSCAAMSFINQFFGYRSEPLTVSVITVQIASLPVGHFLARVLPTKKFRVLGKECSLNPGPFNMKEHVLISIFAQSGYAFGNGSAYAVGIVTIIKAFYHRNISFWASLILIITTQVLGYGWAGILRKYVIEPAHMWWPGTLVQVSLFRALHEKDKKSKGGGLSRETFFLIALICSFFWAFVPAYLFAAISSISILCYIFPKSVTLQQIGSGQSGLSIGAFTFDWNVVVAFLGNPLPVPFFAIANVLVGYLIIVYAVAPVLYWGFDLYNAKTFPFISADLFAADGSTYDTSAIVNNQFELDIPTYEKLGKVNLSMFFAVSYGLGFANISSTVTHVALFYGREIYNRFRNAAKDQEDVHTRLMKKYEDIPSWWFYVTLVLTIIVSLVLCIFMNDQVQLPWWGLLAACVLAFVFTLPVAIITATTNQTPGLNIITEYLMGLALPGKPIANVCFKVYGYMSMAQAISFLNDFKLGHYMKIPPRSMFVVQFVGTILAGTINLITAWWLLNSIEHICEPENLPSNSPWTCPNDNVFFSASVIWGLVGPRRIFGPQGHYSAQNWFFLGGFLGPVIVWLFHKAFPNQKWIPLINLPVLLGASAYIPPASALNYNSWVVIGIFFNYYIFRYKKNWWQKYNYVLSAALDAGVAFMAVLLFLTLNMQNKSLTWWGQDEHCPLANCPTAKGIQVGDCPVF